MYLRIFFTLLSFLIILSGVFFVFNRNIFVEGPQQTIMPSEYQEPIKEQFESRLEVKGSIPYWDQDRAFSSVENYIGTFDYINMFWYYLGDKGTVEKYRSANEDRNIIEFARTNNIKSLAVITNLPDREGSTWDSELVENAIADKNVRDRHIANIFDKIEEVGFDGVTIDYESVEKSQRENFSLFIGELSAVLHKSGKIVAVALHPKTSDSGNGNGAFQDWEALGQRADHLNIMAYGEHWDEGSAGPIASVSWVRRVVGYVKSLSIPSQKIFLGIPLYGYDWNKDDDSGAVGLTHNEVEQLLIENDEDIEWNEEFRSPYFFYKNDNETHEVWFENADSVLEKMKVARKANFAGVTFWRLGGEDQKIWESIDSLD
ncbi:MAG: glycoside hydrolase family protein [uncultured bacterium]|nr:MAG: glycoside hydrolase family protein [uncultured bacterium]OGH13720.1 MAG: hypothetical protein A2687_02930 [Candidatus Levybacteria bacterium RIFCSPHIGHO2_01_FULL_38_26]